MKFLVYCRDSKLGYDELDLKKHTNEYLKTCYFVKEKRKYYLSNSCCSEVSISCAGEICMSLYNNDFEKISSDLLSGFSNLIYIDLTRNGLKTLPARVFEGLINLNVINLGGKFD